MTEDKAEETSLELQIKEMTIANIKKRDQFVDLIVGRVGEVILGDAVSVPTSNLRKGPVDPYIHSHLSPIRTVGSQGSKDKHGSWRKNRLARPLSLECGSHLSQPVLHFRSVILPWSYISLSGPMAGLRPTFPSMAKTWFSVSATALRLS